MGGITFSKFGDWTKAGTVLQSLAGRTNSVFVAQIEEDGELILKTMKDHIRSQDLGWASLSDSTVISKGGDTTIYVETGTLRDGLSVRRVRAVANGVTIFIGASPWKSHSPSGKSLNEIMMWMEYGTDKQPPRPLVRPTWEEMKPIVVEHLSAILPEIIRGVR